MSVFCSYWEVFGAVVETDEVTDGACGPGEFDRLFTVQGKYWYRDFLDGVPIDAIDWRRVGVNLTQYAHRIVAATDRILVEGLAVDKVTVLNGFVAAHPPAKDHWLCPFCYPEQSSLNQ